MTTETKHTPESAVEAIERLIRVANVELGETRHDVMEQAEAAIGYIRASLAAAPELLEALIEVRNRTDIMGKYWDGDSAMERIDVMNMGEIARAAIQKATK
ncbi:MAG: hypothetical protein IPP14_15780 [Planctomycetes bacterium]|nr:hypothetical protein [Planctomycetota bacterium]